MSKYPLIKLGEVATIVSGSTPKTNVSEYWDGEYNWVTPAELNDDVHVIYETERKISEKAVVDTGLKLLPKGTVLLSSRAPIGKVAIAGTEMYCNQGFKNLICSDRIYNKYLFWFLKGKTDYLNSLGRGATFKEISKAIVEKIEVPLPPLKTQEQIAKTLDTVSELLSLRKQQYIELDNLTKSIFYEMFGDPMINEKGFSKVLLGELCELITKGSSPNWQGIEYVNDDTQTLFITSENVREGFLDLSKKKYIHDGFNKIQQRSVLKKGDFLINIVGASIGRAARFDYDIKANINQAVALVRLKKNSINHTYLLAYLNSPKALSMYESMKVSAARANLSLENINNLEILLPPNELQENYEYIATKIEEQKTLVRKSIKETQLLFDSLMSQYFDE